MKKSPDAVPVHEVIAAAGGAATLAGRLGLHRSAVYQWRSQVPADRVVDVEAITGIDRARIRPDVFRDASPEIRANSAA